MIAGTLEIQMMADMARLTRDMGQAKSVVGSAMADISRMVDRAKSVLGALGIGASVAGLALLARSAIDAMDHLNDLSKSTSLSVETLSGLSLAAKQTGSDLDGTAAAINKLSVNIGQNAEKFAKLGVTAKDPLEAFKQLSDVFVAIQDPQTRAAVMAEALGKSWATAAPLLAEGGNKIGEMVEKGAKLSGITSEMAQRADEFNDKLAELTGGGGLLNGQIGSMLPLMNQLLGDIIKLKGNTEGATGSFHPFAEILRVLIVVGGNVAFVLRGIGIEIGGIAAQAAAFLTGDFSRAAEIGRQMKEDAAANRASFDAWERSIMAVTTATRASVPVLDAGDQVSRRLASNTQAATRAFLGKGDAVGKAAKAMKDLSDASAHVETWLKMQIELAKLANAEVDKAIDLEEQLIKAKEAAAGSFRKSVEDLEFEVTLLGKSNAERQIAIALRALEKAGIDTTSASVQAYADRIRAAVEAQEAFKLQQEAIRAQTSLWTDLANAAGDFFADLIMNGKSAFDSLKQWVKQLLAEMIKIFATRWILQMAAGAAGAGGSSAMANSLGSAASNYGSSTLIGAGSAYLFGTGATAYGAGAAAGGAFAGSVATGTVSSAGVIGSGGAMASVYSALSAIPVWGWIAMAVIGAIAYFSGRGGGPKTGGFFSSAGSTDRLYTPSQGDPAMRDVVLATVTTYDALTRRLGGASARGLDFRLGFDHDPNGDARSRVSAELRGAGGESLYSVINRQMDDKEVPAAIALETKRLLLAALQASDFHDEIDKIFDSATDIANMTGEAIDALIAQAREMYAVIDGLAQFGNGRFGLTMTLDSLRLFAAEGETIGQTFQRIGGAWLELVDAFSSDETKLAEANRQLAGLYESLRAFGAEVPTTREGWLDVARGLNDGTEAGAELFARMIALGGAFDLATSAAEAMKVELEGLAQLRFLRAGGSEQGFLIQTLLRNNPLLAAGTAGMSMEQFIANLWTISDADYQRYTATDREIINTLLRGDLNNTNALRDLGSSLGPSASGKSPQEIAFEEYYRTAGARRGLSGWIDQTMTGDLSPLNPTDKLDEARKQYEKMLASAQAGNLDAISGLGGASDTYLRIARELFASSGAYNAIYRDVLTNNAGVAGISTADINTRLAGALPKSGQMASSDDISALRGSVNDLISLISNGVSVRDPEAKASIDRLATNVEQAGRTGTFA